MPARFLIMVASCSAAFLLALIAAAFALDPAGLRRAGDPGAATLRPNRVCEGPEVWKPIAYTRSGARTVFLGSSRVAWGLDASSGAWAGTSAKRFNFGLYGPSMREVAGLAMQLMTQRSADLLLIGLDYGMFHPNHRRSPVRIPGRDEIQDSLASFTHAVLSRRVLRQVLMGCSAYEFDADTGTIWPQVSDAAVRERSMDRVIDEWLGLWASCFGTGCRGSSYQEGLDALRELVRRAAQSGTKLMFFINPLPALHLALIRQAHAGERFEQWKRDLVTIVGEEGDGSSSPVRDFAVFAAEVSGNLYLPPGATDRVPGFVDFSHYSRGLGQAVQRELGSDSVDVFFGAALRPETIESHLKMDRAARALWETAHPQEFSRLRQRVRVLQSRLRIP